MKMDVLYQGLPARFTNAFLSWATTAYVESKGVRIMFDTGFVTQREELPHKLAAVAGIGPEQIDILVLSHMHYDHAYNFDLFTKARILVHEQEYAHAVSNPPHFAYQTFLTQAILATGRLERVAEGYEVAPGVRTLFVPGHTPGCMALVLDDGSMPVTLLAGDAVKNINELATGQMPMVSLPEQAAQSIRTIRSQAELVVPGHDRTLRVMPDRIEAVNSTELTLVYANNCLPEGRPYRLELGVGPSVLPIA